MATVSYVTPTALGEGVDWDDLRGPRLKSLHEALLGAFHTRAELAELLEFGLAKNLDAIAGNGGLTSVVFEVLVRARAEGWLFDLYEAAVAAKPRNRKLLAFARATPIRAVREKDGVLEAIAGDESALQKAVPGAPPPTDLETMLENLAEARGSRSTRSAIASRTAGTSAPSRAEGARSPTPPTSPPSPAAPACPIARGGTRRCARSARAVRRAPTAHRRGGGAVVA